MYYDQKVIINTNRKRKNCVSFETSLNNVFKPKKVHLFIQISNARRVRTCNIQHSNQEVKVTLEQQNHFLHTLKQRGVKILQDVSV